MEKLRFTVKDIHGLHARPALALTQFATGLKSRVSIEREKNHIADCKSLFSVMALGVRQGDCVTLRCKGETALEDSERLEQFCEQLFGQSWQE